MNDLSEFVVLNDTTLVTDSRRVAKHFKKAHKNVLQAFDRLECSEEFNRLNFQPVEELDEKGEARRVVRMTKDGFMFLAMGFKGAEAAKFKEAFINAFNAMADQLQQIGNSLWKQYLDLEKRDATSFMWASFGSKRMLDRKREKPLLENERQLLESEMQPTLFPRANEVLQ
jgi:Rha family phage regulatory protein